MPIKFKISDDGALVVEQWSGVIGHDEAVRFESDLLRDTRFAPRAVAFSDARLATFPESTADNIRELAEPHRAPHKTVSVTRSAILTVMIDTFDKAQLYRDACAEFGLEVRLFTETQPACEWLGVSPETVETMLRELNDGIPTDPI